MNSMQLKYKLKNISKEKNVEFVGILSKKQEKQEENSHAEDRTTENHLRSAAEGAARESTGLKNAV